MLSHLKWIVEEQDDENNTAVFALYKRFEEVVTALRTAQATEGLLSKENTAFDDTLDSLRLNVSYYRRSVQNPIEMKRSKMKKINVEHKNVVIIDSGTDQIKEIICPNQNCGLIIHTRKSQGNLTCPHCLFEFEVEKTRRKSKLSTPGGRDIEPAISSIPSWPSVKDVSIRRGPEPQGAFKMLQDKGLRIKNYREELPK